MTRFAGLERGAAKVSRAILVNDNSPSRSDSEREGFDLIWGKLGQCDTQSC